MASKAYLKALKEIPKNIQEDVIGSLNIANEIHLALKDKNLCPADLARLMNKSESEISKWLTGLHNFTYNTIRKIETALEVDLIVLKSSKISSYEEKLCLANKQIMELQQKLQLKEIDRIRQLAFDESSSFSCSNMLMGNPNIKETGYSNLVAFFIGGVNDCVKIEPKTQSTLKLEYANL